MQFSQFLRASCGEKYWYNKSILKGTSCTIYLLLNSLPKSERNTLVMGISDA